MKKRKLAKNIVAASEEGMMLPVSHLQEEVNKHTEKSPRKLQKNFDVIVLGVGSMGAASCYYLARQGCNVLGLEQFDIPHELGSHAGQSRIIRKAYFEHPDYVPLLQTAYKNWKHLEKVSGAKVYFKTGLLYYGKANHPLITGVKESAAKYSVPLQEISVKEQAKNFPQFRIPSNFTRLIEPDAGLVTPERAILLYTEMALRNGAYVHTKEKIIEWSKAGNTIRVKTDKATYECKKLVITVGAWAGSMIPGLAKKLTITRQMIAWVKPKKWKPFELGNFPCWMIADTERPGIYYGFPVLSPGKFGGPVGLKLAHHYQGVVADPDTINRVPTAADEENLLYALNKFIPDGYESTHIMKTCMYTNTPDENFILDYVPGYDKDVVMATGFSGHGFKFASVVGEIMADLALKGSTRQPIGFLSANRFS